MLLNNTFNTQFIITTNSPHIINCKEECFVYHLKENEDKEIVVERQYQTYGRDINSVLTNLMDLEYTRPSKVCSEINEVYKMIKDNNLSKALEIIKNLENKIGSDPTLMKARVLIKRKKIIGK